MSIFFRSLLVIVSISAVPNISSAQKQAKIDYGPKCGCQFGYGGNACVIALACTQEGGHCTKPCVEQPDDQAIH